MEADEIDLLTGAVFGDVQQVDNPEKAGFAGEGGRDIGQADGLNGIDLDVAFLHGIACSDPHVEALPDTDGAGDFAAADGVAETPGEGHGESVHRMGLG